MTKKKCMVFETMNNIQDMNIVENASNPDEIRLHGVFGVAGIRNNNNRVYDKKNYGMMVESLQKVIAKEGCLGELEHPNSMNIDLNNVSHKIEEIHMNEDGTVTGTILLLDTDKGKNAKAIVKAGVPLYISSRAAGNIDENGNVTLTTLKTYDLVGTPGFSEARLDLAENQKFESLNENLCIIYEDDLLDSDDSDDDKKDKSKDDSSKEDKSNDSDENKDKENKEEKTDTNKSDESDDNNDDNKNSDNNINMNELKQAIDKLTEKVTNLEAELHVAQESKVNYDAIEKWVTEEFAPNFMNDVNEKVDSAVSESIETVCNNVQNWICEEFAPEVQNWLCEEFAPEVQNWITEEYTPEMVHNWVNEEFAPEVHAWVCEQFAPQVQGWITEEFAPVVESWLTDELLPENNNKINENISAFMESQKNTKLSEIDAMLETLAEDKNQALELLKEQKAADKFAGVYVIENMPAQYQPLWNGLNEEKQQEIIRQSRAYDFTKAGVLESFWDSVDFTNNTTAATAQVNEQLNPIEARQQAIFRQAMALRH